MPSRLVLRIYLVAVGQFLLVALALAALQSVDRPRMFPFAAKQADYVAAQLSRAYDDPKRLREELELAARKFDWTVDVRDPAGTVVAHAEPETSGAPAMAPVGSTQFGVGRGESATLEYRVHPPSLPPPHMRGSVIIPMILAIIGVVSVLVARSLATPLDRLAKTARALGEGNLEARARIRRRDEIGQVAAAFDDMADRIASLVVAERELLANVSHELRTPLARVRVALEIANESDDPQTALESLKEIAADLYELERLVEDVLAMARLTHDSGGTSSAPRTLRPRTEALDLEALIEQVASRFRARHPQCPLALVLHNLAFIDGDPVLLRRAIDNLLDNARKYGATDPESGIELYADNDGEHVVIEVRDHGIGIAEADLARVFEPFFRADRSRARGTGGVGLGLALVKRVVEAHQGTVSLESKLGVGTVARVRLPRQKAQ